jgi:hypothetical protein
VRILVEERTDIRRGGERGREQDGVVGFARQRRCGGRDVAGMAHVDRPAGEQVADQPGVVVSLADDEQGRT